jgi:hypothetical protein
MKKKPFYGEADGKATHCATCARSATDGVKRRDIKSKMCVICLKTQPSYGEADGKATHCATCARAATDGVKRRDVKCKMCVICLKTRPCYGEADGKATHCAACVRTATDGVARQNVVSKTCVICDKTRPSYGEADGRATHCATCARTATDKIKRRDVTHEMCVICEKTRASYGDADGRATHCAKCARTATDGIGRRNVAHGMCVICEKTLPSYGEADGKATHCAPCARFATDGVERRNVTHEMCVICEKTLPSYGEADGKATHCAPCARFATDGVERRNVVNKRCIDCMEAGITTHASCGTTDEPTSRCRPHAEAFWRDHSVPLPNRIASNGKMVTSDRSYSRESIEFLEWFASALNLDVIHKESVRADGSPPREVMILANGKRYAADGFVPAHNLVLEYHGCYWHGCTRCFPSASEREKPREGSRTLALSFQKTLDKESALRAGGFAYVEVWGHEWEDMQADDNAKALFANRARSLLGMATVATKRRARSLLEYTGFSPLAPTVSC